MEIKPKKLHRPPPEYWKFAVLVGAHAGLLLSIGPAKVLGVFLVRFKEEFDANSGPIGAITTLTYFILALAGLGASILCKRHSCRVITMIGGLIISLGLVLTSFARNIFQLVLCINILTGIGIGLVGNPCLVVVSHYFDKQYATANGVAMAGADLALVILPPLTEHLTEMYCWRGALLLLGGISLNVAAMGALFRPNSHTKDGISDGSTSVEECTELNQPKNQTDFEDVDFNDDTDPNSTENIMDDSTKITTDDKPSKVTFSGTNEQTENAVDNNELSGSKVTVLRKFVISMDLPIFTIRKYQVLLPVTMLVASANSSILAHIVARGISTGLSPFSASFLISGVGATSMIARATHGLIIDKGIMSATRLYTLALFLGSLFSFLSLLCYNFTTFLLYTLFYGAVCGIFQCASIPIAKSCVPSRMIGGAIAWLFIFRGLGAFLGGLIAGSLFDATGNYDCSFIVIAASFMLAAILMVIFSYAKGRKKRRDSIILSPADLNVRQCVGI